MMNKHDELIARLNWRANKLAGPGWLMHNCVADLRDAQQLLQLYGDALVRLGDAELIAVTPERTDWLEIYQSEFDARIYIAKTTAEGE